MSAKPSLVALTFAFAALAFLPTLNFAQTINEVVMANVTGTVTVTEKATGEESKAANRKKIGQGYSITTGAGGSVILLFSNGSTVKVSENTNLSIDQFFQDEHDVTTPLAALIAEPGRSIMRLNLDYGKIIGSTKELNFSSSFNVHTPVGIAGIRGTDFVVQLVPAGSTGRWEAPTPKGQGDLLAGHSRIESMQYIRFFGGGGAAAETAKLVCKVFKGEVVITLIDDTLHIVGGGKRLSIPIKDGQPVPEDATEDNIDPDNPDDADDQNSLDEMKEAEDQASPPTKVDPDAIEEAIEEIFDALTGTLGSGGN